MDYKDSAVHPPHGGLSAIPVVLFHVLRFIHDRPPEVAPQSEGLSEIVKILWGLFQLRSDAAFGIRRYFCDQIKKKSFFR